MRNKSEIVISFALAMLSADIQYIINSGRFTPRMGHLWNEYIEVCKKEDEDGRPKE